MKKMEGADEYRNRRIPESRENNSSQLNSRIHEIGQPVNRWMITRITRITSEQGRRGNSEDERETYTFCEPAGDFLRNPGADLLHAFPDTLQAAAFAVLHEDLDLGGRRGDIGSKEMDDIHMFRAGRDFDFPQQLDHRRLVRGDRLAGHDDPRASVAHLVYGTACALT